MPVSLQLFAGRLQLRDLRSLVLSELEERFDDEVAVHAIFPFPSIDAR